MISINFEKMSTMKNLVLLLLVISFQSCQSQTKPETSEKTSAMNTTVKKTDAEWKAQLSKMEYEVLRNKGTERAFTGEYYDHFEKENTFVQPAEMIYLLLTLNLIRIAVGLHLMKQSKVLLFIKKI